MAAVALLVNHWVADLWFGSRADNALLGTTLNAYFSKGPSSLPVVVAQADEILATRTKNGVVCVGLVRQMQSAGSHAVTHE